MDESTGLRCKGCKSFYPFVGERGFADLRPPAGTFGDLTEYAEEEFHHRPGPLRPPFLSARIKIDQMSKMLDLSSNDRVLDIGCGNGRAAYYKRARSGQLVAIDAGDHYAPETLATIDLARGDIRRLPFASASFDKAYSLDVLEHLTEDGVETMLSEARRVLRPGGRLFVYSHVMMSSWLARFQRKTTRLVHWLDRKGLVDNAPERERKSDHRNALASYQLLERLITEAGFQIEDIRYYNVVFKAIFEDLLLPLVEHNVYGRTAKRKAPSVTSGPSIETAAPTAARPNVGRWAHGPLALATVLMKLDVLLFGRIRTGPFFLLLRSTDAS
jgi:ubiquinone/menaquinone biosynthesis C-methylase UbiE